MKKLSIFTTMTHPIERGDNFKDAIHCYMDLADELVVVDGSKTNKAEAFKLIPKSSEQAEVVYVHNLWPKEFDWPLIGQQFQRGYEAATGDWVIHADIDFLFHENDFGRIRQAIEDAGDAPALSFYKYQFILPDRYNLKSRLVIAVNKGKYGDRIKFDSGGDLCQPSLDGQEITPDHARESGIAFYNYEKILKDVNQITEDVGRMARAWQSHFGVARLGADNESAFEEWATMIKGRFTKPQKEIPITDHPKYVQKTIMNLTRNQFGWDGLGMLPKNNYIKARG